MRLRRDSRAPEYLAQDEKVQVLEIKEACCF